jgi:hypothetical protein
VKNGCPLRYPAIERTVMAALRQVQHAGQLLGG